MNSTSFYLVTTNIEKYKELKKQISAFNMSAYFLNVKELFNLLAEKSQDQSLPYIIFDGELVFKLSSSEMMELKLAIPFRNNFIWYFKNRFDFFNNRYFEEHDVVLIGKISLNRILGLINERQLTPIEIFSNKKPHPLVFFKNVFKSVFK